MLSLTRLEVMISKARMAVGHLKKFKLPSNLDFFSGMQSSPRQEAGCLEKCPTAVETQRVPSLSLMLVRGTLKKYIFLELLRPLTNEISPVWWPTRRDGFWYQKSGRTKRVEIEESKVTSLHQRYMKSSSRAFLRRKDLLVWTIFLISETGTMKSLQLRVPMKRVSSSADSFKQVMSLKLSQDGNLTCFLLGIIMTPSCPSSPRNSMFSVYSKQVISNFVGTSSFLNFPISPASFSFYTSTLSFVSDSTLTSNVVSVLEALCFFLVLESFLGLPSLGLAALMLIVDASDFLADWLDNRILGLGEELSLLTMGYLEQKLRSCSSRATKVALSFQFSLSIISRKLMMSFPQRRRRSGQRLKETWQPRSRVSISQRVFPKEQTSSLIL